MRVRFDGGPTRIPEQKKEVVPFEKCEGLPLPPVVPGEKVHCMAAYPQGQDPVYSFHVGNIYPDRGIIIDDPIYKRSPISAEELERELKRREKEKNAKKDEPIQVDQKVVLDKPAPNTTPSPGFDMTTILTVGGALLLAYFIFGGKE